MIICMPCQVEQVCQLWRRFQRERLHTSPHLTLLLYPFFCMYSCRPPIIHGDLKGSRRFMAPEVALSEPYALSADIYSFGILLWEVLALKKSFGNMSVEEHRECVIRKDERPPMDPSWTEEIQSLLKKCWRRSPYDRPEAKDVYKILRRECQAIYYDEFAPNHK